LTNVAQEGRRLLDEAQQGTIAIGSAPKEALDAALAKADRYLASPSGKAGRESGFGDILPLIVILLVSAVLAFFWEALSRFRAPRPKLPMPPMLQWSEPKDARYMFRALRSVRQIVAARLLGRTIVFLVGFGFTFVLLFGGGTVLVAEQGPLHFAKEVVFISTIFGLLAAFLVPLALRRFGSTKAKARRVRLLASEVRCGLDGGIEKRWKYRDLAGWSVVERSFRGNPLRVLSLKLRDGKTAAMGLAEAITRDHLAQAFNEKGVPEVAIG
jgi:hypothetical protein